MEMNIERKLHGTGWEGEGGGGERNVNQEIKTDTKTTLDFLEMINFNTKFCCKLILCRFCSFKKIKMTLHFNKVFFFKLC